MTRQIFFILIFGLTKIQAQSGFLDSIFYKIPFTTDLRTTKQFLSKNNSFLFHSADTISAHGHHSISFTTTLKNSIPNKSIKTTYRKSTIKILVDGKMPEYCIKFSSNIEFAYKTKSTTIKDFNSIVKFLELKLKPKLVAGLVNLKGERYGYELYLSDTKHCNYVTVTYGQYSETNFISVSYN